MRRSINCAQARRRRTPGWVVASAVCSGGFLRGIVSSRRGMRSLRASTESVSGMGVGEADQFLGETARRHEETSGGAQRS
jgi:hypothetical protein